MGVPQAFILPNGKRVGTGAYVKAWRTLRAAPPDQSFKGFGHFPERADYILREFRYGMHDRINRHIPGHGIGRKWDSNWQRDMGHAARWLNSRVVIHPGMLPFELRERFAHRLHED